MLDVRFGEQSQAERAIRFIQADVSTSEGVTKVLAATLKKSPWSSWSPGRSR
jgi:hypothetical protein